MKTVFNVHNLTYLKYKINLNEKKTKTSSLSFTLFTSVSLCSSRARGRVRRSGVSERPFIRSRSVVLPLHLCSDEGLNSPASEGVFKYEPITVNKKKLCINPGAIATSLGHSFLFPFTPSGHVSPLPSSLLSPTMVTFYRPNLNVMQMMWTTSVCQLGVSWCACWTCWL